MPPTESLLTDPFNEEDYKQIPDIRNRLHSFCVENEGLFREGTEPINDDDIRASIEMRGAPIRCYPSIHETYLRSLGALLVESATWQPYLFALCSHHHSTLNDYWATIQDKVGSFSQLKQGWDGYSAPRPTVDAIENAKEFLNVLKAAEFRPNRLKPSVVGGIGITFRHDVRRVYVEFYNDGRVFALRSDGETEPETRKVRPKYSEYLILLRDIRKYLYA